MRKLLSLTLILLILPVSLIFVSCKDKETRSISNFYNSYLDISTSNIRLTEQLLDSRFNNNENLYLVKFSFSDELQLKIDGLSASPYNPYNKINSFYDILLEDVSAPIAMYGKALNSSDVSKDETSNIYSRLDQLKSAYISTATKLGDLEATLNDPAIASTNLKQLFASFETLIQKASNLSNLVTSVYFNNVMQDANPNYVAQQLNEINLTTLAQRTLNRKAYYISVYADIFLNVYILGNNVPEQMMLGTFSSQFEPYQNLSTVRYSTNTNELESNRETLVNLARSLYLIQKDFDREYQRYHDAIEKITYSLVNANSSTETNGYKNIIDQFVSNNGIAYASFSTITDILDLSYTKTFS